MSPVLLRSELREFADEMERELRRHDPKKGDSWKNMDPEQLAVLLAQAHDKMTMLMANLIYPAPKYFQEGDIAAARNQVVDISNLSMMLWHRLKGA